jgi:hypothetical protein
MKCELLKSLELTPMMVIICAYELKTSHDDFLSKIGTVSPKRRNTITLALLGSDEEKIKQATRIYNNL